MATAAVVFSGFVAALIAPGLYRLLRGATVWFVAALPLALTVYFLALIDPVSTDQPVAVSYSWIPSLGISLSFYIDGLSLLFAILISGIGTLIVIYAGSYLAGNPGLGRFYAILLIFMASMLGLVLANNLLTLFIFWEATSLSSYFLIGFDHNREKARAAALQALLVTGAGGLALLAGFLLLGNIAGTYEILQIASENQHTDTLLSQAQNIQQHALYVPALILILVGAFTKSAQFPFHFWLPSAMEAPTPVSAYLHSATMVKAGVYLLARLYPVLGGRVEWFILVTTFGVVTMLVGGLLAVQATDLKRILAYSTVSALGLLTSMLGVGSALAVEAAMVFLLGHALYKAALFLVAGILDHETGTRDVTRLGGLGKKMPLTAGAAVLAALSMAGIPPLFGFLAKETYYEATLDASASLALTTAAVVASMIFVAVAIMVGIRPFMGKTGETPKPPHEATASLWSAPLLLAILGLVFGLYPAVVENALLNPSATAVLQPQRSSLHLALWHGWTFTLFLSGITLIGGVGVYAFLGSARVLSSRLQGICNLGPARAYELCMTGLMKLATVQTKLLQSGYLRNYLITIVLFAVTLIGTSLVVLGTVRAWPDPTDVTFYEVALAVLIVLGALAAALSTSRFTAVAALGVVGYGVSLIFILFSAPDLAMTQFLIETLTVILFVLVFYHLPGFTKISARIISLRDAGIAATVGILMTGLVLSSARWELSPPISGYFVEQSKPLAHGRNVVNVILVDFRALDTLGEISVLALAGVGVYALLKLRVKTRGFP